MASVIGKYHWLGFEGNFWLQQALSGLIGCDFPAMAGIE
jgi:hypothetical protein